MNINNISLTVSDILEIEEKFYTLLEDVEITEDSKKTYAYAQHLIDTEFRRCEGDDILQQLLDNDFEYDGHDYKKDYLENEMNEPFDFDCKGATALFFADEFEFLAKQVREGM